MTLFADPSSFDRELAAIVESSADAIIGKTLDGVIRSWNPAAESMYGYAASEVIGRSIAILVPPDHVDELAEILERLRRGERLEHFETVRVRKDGSEIDVSLTVSPIERDGSIVGASSIARDVSTRRRAERRSIETLALLEAIEATAPVGFAFVDRDFRIIRVNETLATVSGASIERLVGLPLAKAIPDIWPELEGALVHVLATGEPVTGREFVYPSAPLGGDVRYWLTSLHPVSVEAVTSGIGIVAFNITERKRTEEALRAAKEYAERLIDTSNAIVLVLDDQANIEVINKAGEEITGYPREELVGRNWDVVVPRDRYPGVWAAYADLVTRGLERFENPILTKAGEERIILWRNTQVVEGDRVTGTVSFGVDVTESVQARREAAQSHELLRAADQERRALLTRLVHAQEDERRRFAGEIHDDPLQALSVLAMTLDMLAKGIDDPGLLSDLSRARESVRTAIASLRQMIFTLHPLVLDRDGLGRALDEQLEQLRQQTGVNILFENELAREPAAAVGMIAFRIAQEALMNIRKHAGARNVKVSVDQTQDGLAVRIADDGRGFDEGETHPGHLGLVSMRERAEMAGGWCTIASELTRGTTVEFLLPLVDG